MLSVFIALLRTARLSLGSRVTLQLEILALRHQSKSSNDHAVDGSI